VTSVGPYSRFVSWKGFPKFVEVVILLRGLVLSSKILNLKILLNRNLCLLCIDVLSNLCASAIIFCLNFSVKLFNDNSPSLLLEATWK
jgi:hypothetical protein